MQKYVVEHEYTKPLTDELMTEESRRAEPCLEQHGVTWMASYLSIDRMKQICEFEAETAEQIRDALRSADVPFARVWPAIKYQR